MKQKISIRMTASNLKIFGYVTMMFYTVGKAIIENGLLHINAYTDIQFAVLLKENADQMILSGWAVVFSFIGVLAVPVFAFTLVEGFQHTSDLKKYFLRMSVFALLSEIPYDMAMHQKFFDFSDQNVLFTLAVCLIMLYGLRIYHGKSTLRCRIVKLVIVMAALLWCSILHSAFGMCMVLLVAVYYLFYDKKGIRILIGCGISSLYVTAPFSGYALWNYNGELGCEQKNRIFYWIYPIHLLLFGIISMYIM